jgi:hypothetical protein
MEVLAAADKGRPANLKGQAPQLVFLQCNGICTVLLCNPQLRPIVAEL